MTSSQLLLFCTFISRFFNIVLTASSSCLLVFWDDSGPGDDNVSGEDDEKLFADNDVCDDFFVAGSSVVS